MQNNTDIKDFVISGSTLIKYSGTNKNIIIPVGITKIESAAFIDNTFIETIDFQNSVKEIGQSAFENCKNLIDIKGNNSVEVYGNNCFKNAGLIELCIYNNTRIIGRDAFLGNNNLVKLYYLPERDLSLNNAFAKCIKLEDVEMDRKYFYPSFAKSKSWKQTGNNSNRPSFGDAFFGTPFFKKMKKEYIDSYKKKICPDCGGKISKILFFYAKCKNCKIVYKKISY